MNALPNRNGLIVGHSHITAVARALETAHRRGKRYSLTWECLKLHLPEFRPSLIAGELAPALKQALLGKNPERVVSMVGGNAHNELGLVNSVQSYDFVLPYADELPNHPDARILPYELIMDELHERNKSKGFFDLLTCLAELFGDGVVHVESPPPIPANDHVIQHPGVFAEAIEESGVAPPLFRYKLWKASSTLFEKHCEQIGIKFLPAPLDMQDEQGMMIEAGWGKRSPTHGNVNYGRAIMRQLEELADNEMSSVEQLHNRP